MLFYLIIISKESGKKSHIVIPGDFIVYSGWDCWLGSCFLSQQGLDAEGAELVKFMSPHLRELSLRKWGGGQPNKQVSPETRQLSSWTWNKIEN